MRLDPTGNERSLLLPGIEEADKFKPTTSRPHALHLQFYSSVSVWRGTEGGGVDAHRKLDHKEQILTCGNTREGAYGCCLDLIASQNTSEIANCRERHLEEYILTPGNKREGAYGCCLDLIASQNTSEIAN